MLTSPLFAAAWALTICLAAGNRHALRWACCLAASYAIDVTWTLAAGLVTPEFNANGLAWMDLHKLVIISIDAGITLWVFHTAKVRWEYALERAIAISLVPSFGAFIGAIDPPTFAAMRGVVNMLFIAILLSGRLGRGGDQDHRCGAAGHLVRSIAVAAKRPRCDTPWTARR